MLPVVRAAGIRVGSECAESTMQQPLLQSNGKSRIRVGCRGIISRGTGRDRVVKSGGGGASGHPCDRGNAATGYMQAMRLSKGKLGRPAQAIPDDWCYHTDVIQFDKGS